MIRTPVGCSLVSKVCFHLSLQVGYKLESLSVTERRTSFDFQFDQGVVEELFSKNNTDLMRRMTTQLASTGNGNQGGTLLVMHAGLRQG